MSRASPKSLISPLGRPRLFPLSTTWLNGSLFTFRSRLYFIIYYYLLILLILILVLTIPRIVAPVLPGHSEIPDTGERHNSKIASPRPAQAAFHHRFVHFIALSFYPVKLIYNVSPTFATTPLVPRRSLVRSYATHCKSSGQPALIAAHVGWICRKEVIVVRHKVQSPSFLLRVGSMTLLFSFPSV